VNANDLILTPEERSELQRRVRSRSMRAEDSRRARVILALASGRGLRETAASLSCSTSYLQRWLGRFRAERLGGLVARHKGRAAAEGAAKVEARILEWTRRGPDDGSTQWSTRRLAKKLGTTHMAVVRVWNRYGLQPHRLRHHMVSDDPDFETKAADIIGLYLHPPAHAAVFCVDEKTAIQALDRLDPVLPLSPGRAESHGFEYFRHGTLSLYAALETQSGEILGKTARRHTSAEFVSFLEDIVASQPAGKVIHVIADNLSAHKTKLVDAFLEVHPNVRMHFTPTYSSWLNQVENWFAKIQRHVITRGVFSSLNDLRVKLLRYIRHYNKTATPIQWTYSNPRRRIKP
jgi:transposase